MKRSNKGFTLIELMVVIVIMGVLAVLAIPKLTDVITKAKVGEIPIVLGSWEHAQMAYIAEKGACATDVDSMAYEEPTSKWFLYGHTAAAAASVTYAATVQENKKVGPFTSTSDGVTSTITDESVVTHGLGAFTKYLSNY